MKAARKRGWVVVFQNVVLCSFDEKIIPEEKNSIIEFLTSGLFKGIGEVKAKKIVEVLVAV